MSDESIVKYFFTRVYNHEELFIELITLQESEIVQRYFEFIGNEDEIRRTSSMGVVKTAILKGNLDMLRIFNKHGLFSRTERDAKTCMQLAINSNNFNTVKYLHKHLTNKFKCELLAHYMYDTALQSGNREIFMWLIEKDVKIPLHAIFPNYNFKDIEHEDLITMITTRGYKVPTEET
jgi:hypothetical protein